MYTGVEAAGWPAALFFVINVVVGTYIVLNLFLAILIDNFCNSEDEDVEEEENDEVNSISGDGNGQVHPTGVGSLAHVRVVSARITKNGGNDIDLQNGGDVEVPAAGNGVVRADKSDDDVGSLWERFTRSLSTFQRDAVLRFVAHPSYPHRSFFMSGRNPLRRACGVLVLHPFFDAVILFLICGSCAMLALDAPSTSDDTRALLEEIDVYVTGMFIAELVLKMTAFGVLRHSGAYFRDMWNLLDFFIVVVSAVDLVAGNGIKAIKVVRFLRALRPLRMVRRLDGLRLVLHAVVGAIPNCVHVAMVAVLFHLIFGILGVNFFGGRFYSCSDPSRTCFPEWAEPGSCAPEDACVGVWTPPDTGPCVCSHCPCCVCSFHAEFHASFRA